ncbi:acetyl esterase/lipase [Paraburkholderia sp. BL27I4N3]|uniref:alpha/beta hydrolase n=1 Tax=Paraburkholderia sp. BL27I4N3 TaxID=1938805 RepID=UPI000E26D72C|nr:alpha/beta hydrolase [Paraburkholderia sp. BL27I4N3]REE07123.1 acetyl esterase/lipase [Paraburkholderia sp. BL27I4N3]
MLTDKSRAFVESWRNSLVDLGPVLTGENKSATMTEVRASYTKMLAQNPAPAGVSFENIVIGGVPGQVAIPDDIKTTDILVYIHGGAYIVGEPAGYHGISGNFAKLLGAKVFMPDYRLAPEHPFPAAIDDTLKFYKGLLDDGHAANKIVFAGESAGGALTVTTMVAARNSGLPLPAGGVSISTWANLEHTGISMTNREGIDPLNTKAGLVFLASKFLQYALPGHPMASPVFADVTGLPPIMVQMGEAEQMLTDGMRLATHLAENRVRVTLEVWPHMFHAWHFMSTEQPEAKQALANAAQFMQQCLRDADAR